MDEVKYIEEIANGVKNLKKHLRKSVVKMCEKVLKPLIEQVHNRPNLQEKLKNSLKKHFQDIYWSLKLHLVFHCGTGNDPHELQEMGRSVYLTEDELAALPDQNCAVDPWSKLMEIFSVIEKHPQEQDREHAEGVKRKAESFLETLSNKNIFKPKVLATVSHNDKWSVGSSIAVSQFLRPLCLHKRIARFKPSLKQAVAFYQPLVIAQNQNWSSWAVTTNSKWELKPACENCARMFGNLNGFIDPNLALGGKDTFLAACAEYFPVNQLLKDEQDPLSLSENERQRINAAVEENRKKCTLYYKNFREIEKKCLDACKAEGESKNVKCAEVYMEINKTVHIFGRKPECNAYFGSVN